MQVAEVGTYKITLYRNNDGLWEFWIKQKGHLLVKSTGTTNCGETKRTVQQHLYEIVMNKKENSHFDPKEDLEWHNDLCAFDGDNEVAG
jgi:hypothetical protein